MPERASQPVERRHRPLPRRPYVAVALAVLLWSLAFIVVALAVLLRRDFPGLEVLCPLVCVGVVLIAALLPLSLRHSRARWRAVGGIVRNEEAAALLRAGRYREAAQMWETLCAESRYQPVLHALYCFNVATAFLHLGDPARAIAVLQAVQRSGWPRAPSLRHIRPKLDAMMALAYAVRGEVEDATRHRDASVTAVGEAQRGSVLLVDAIVAARRGQFEGIATDGQWRLAEANLSPSHVRGLRLLEAFARERGDGVYRSPPGDGTDLDAFPPVRAGELDFLAVQWPELRAFMQGRGLLRDEAPRPPYGIKSSALP